MSYKVFLDINAECFGDRVVVEDEMGKVEITFTDWDKLVEWVKQERDKL